MSHHSRVSGARAHHDSPEAGTPLDLSNYTVTRVCKRVLRCFEPRRCRTSATTLRRTFATLLRAAGAPITVVAA